MPATILLILPTGTYRADEYLSAAERLGLDVVTASERPQALAGVMGDKFLEVALDKPEAAAAAIAALSRRRRLDAVVAVDDQGLLAAALAAEQIGLPHSPVGAVRLTRDKAAMRAAFATAGVPQPEFLVVGAQPVAAPGRLEAEPAAAPGRLEAQPAAAPGRLEAQPAAAPGTLRADRIASPEAVAAAAETLGFPVVVKPPSLSASRGVIRANSRTEAVEAAERRVVAILLAEGEDAGRLIVERYLPPPEVAVEGICRGGDIEIIAIFDKPDPMEGPYFEETFYVSPSRLPAAYLTAVGDAAKTAVKALGLTDGPFHAELRGPEPAVLEVAARTIGGRCSKAMRLDNGWGLEELVLSNAAGTAPWPPPPLAGACGILMIPIPAPGTLTAVSGVDDARAVDGITGVEITITNGRTVRQLPEGDRYLGFVFAQGETPAAVEASLRSAQQRLSVVIAQADTVT